MCLKNKGRVLWPETPLTDRGGGTYEDAAMDLRVLINRGESYRHAADVVVGAGFSAVPAIPNVTKGLEGIGYGACKYPDLCYAVAFLYRQWLEILLKCAILLGRRLGDQESSFPGIHDVRRLWRKVEPVLKQWCPAVTQQQLVTTSDHIRQLSQLAKGSTEFRYPRNKGGWDVVLPSRQDLQGLCVPIGEFLASCIAEMYEQRKSRRLATNTGG